MRRVLNGYGRGDQPLPVYKMPHMDNWAQTGEGAYVPAVGRHEVLVIDTRNATAKVANGRGKIVSVPRELRDNSANSATGASPRPANA